jgi:arylsulfatase A
VAICMCAVSTFAASAESKSSAARPNIIYILADDLGYGDLGCYGSTLNRTPNLDRMATGGIRFTDFHAANWCLPSRKALMSGRHPNRKVKFEGETQTLAEMLKANGYFTAMLGKWHLGWTKGKTMPTDQGFDYFWGTKGSNDWNGPSPKYDNFKNASEEAWKMPIYEGYDIVIKASSQSQLTKLYTERAVKIIKENKDSPFFLYLSHNMPHVPIFASKAFKGKSKNGIYGDVIEELDWGVGEVLKAVQEAGVAENTLIVFTSDNGPWTMFEEFGGTAGVLRGEKSTTWEGGDRVPAIFYWPSTLKPTVSDSYIHNCDVFATVAKLTGGTIREGEAIDSMDFSGTLLRAEASPRTKYIYCHKIPMAYRSRDYKIYFETRERTRNPMTGKKEPNVKHKSPLLFNLKKDPGETKNVAKAYPEIVKRLAQEYEKAKETLRTADRKFQ